MRREHEIESQATCLSLVSQSGIRESVADHDLAAF